MLCFKKLSVIEDESEIEIQERHGVTTPGVAKNSNKEHVEEPLDVNTNKENDRRAETTKESNESAHKIRIPPKYLNDYVTCL